jgi:predicted  nucleic acid-binding Zn-ribbon protein
MPKAEESRLLRCTKCGELYAGSATNDATLLLDGAASGGGCHECGGDTFEEVTITPSD